MSKITTNQQAPNVYIYMILIISAIFIVSYSSAYKWKLTKFTLRKRSSQVQLRTSSNDTKNTKKPEIPDFESLNCSNINFATLNTFSPPIILYSYPGSGNTWVRHMLEITSGYYTGSIYADRRIFSSGMLGEMEPTQSGRTVVVKSHTLDKRVYSFAEKCIETSQNFYFKIRSKSSALNFRKNRRLFGSASAAWGRAREYWEVSLFFIGIRWMLLCRL